MIEFNLLPDIKIQYIKAKRARQLVTTVAIIISAVSLVVLILTVSVKLYQAKRLGDLNDDIAKNSKSLAQIPNLNKILTVQNQLNSLTELHSAKPTASRGFTYLLQTAPKEIKFTNYTIDFTLNTVTISGKTNALSSVNKFVDTLKFTKLTGSDKESGDTIEEAYAFKDVVLATFGVTDDSDKPDEKVSYSITLVYDPLVFDDTKNIALVIPQNKITTRSVLETEALFVKTDAKDEKN